MQNTGDPEKWREKLKGQLWSSRGKGREEKETRSSSPEINASKSGSVRSNWRNKPGILTAGCFCLKYPALALGKSLPHRTALRDLRG